MSAQTLLSMTEAANMVGLTRPTFYRKAKYLGLSTVTDQGKRKVDVSELIRVFGSDVKIRQKNDNSTDRASNEKLSKLSKSTSNSSNSEQTASEDFDNQIRIIKLEAELDIEKALRIEAKEQVEYLKEQIQVEKEEKRNMGLQITDQRERADRVGTWEKSIKAMESRIANQEQESKERNQREQKLSKQNQVLRKALQEEKSKGLFGKLFGG